MTATTSQWAKLMDKVGLTSVRQLAKAAGIDHTIVNRVITKGSTTSAENMERIAGALQVPVEELYELKSGTPATPLVIPGESEMLSERQKTAIVEVIRSMVEDKKYAAGLSAELAKFVDKKSPEATQPVQEKTTNVTPIGGRSGLTPAQQKFEDTGRRVAKIRRDIPQDSPKIDPVSPDTGE